MPKFVGVASWKSINDDFMKRAALLFEEIVPHGVRRTEQAKFPFAQVGKRFLEYEPMVDWLIEHGVIRLYDYEINETTSSTEAFRSEFEKIQNLLTEQVDSLPGRDRSEGFQGFIRDVQRPLVSQITRAAAIAVRDKFQVDAYPLLGASLPEAEEPTGKATVANVVIEEFPQPDDSVAWEDILLFRQEEQDKLASLDLRQWMGEMAKGTLEPLELAQKLEYLIEVRREALRIHKMKVANFRFQTLVVVLPEMLSQLVRLKFGEMVKTPFTIREQHIKLLEGEASLPGGEVAYVVRAQERFNR